MELKKCQNCNENFPITNFYPRKDGKNGVRSFCKVCHNQKYRGKNNNKDDKIFSKTSNLELIDSINLLDSLRKENENIKKELEITKQELLKKNELINIIKYDEVNNGKVFHKQKTNIEYEESKINKLQEEIVNENANPHNYEENSDLKEKLKFLKYIIDNSQNYVEVKHFASTKYLSLKSSNLDNCSNPIAKIATNIEIKGLVKCNHKLKSKIEKLEIELEKKKNIITQLRKNLRELKL